MGIDDVIIHNITPSEDGTEYILTGESFTKWSRVYVNGEKVSTSYISGNELSIKASNLKDGDSVVVNQLGSSSTIFRSSNEVIFEAPISTETLMEDLPFETPTGIEYLAE